MPYGRQRRRAGVAISVALAVGLLQSLVLAPAAAQADMQAGWQAYTAGDYEAAIREWQPLAEDGDYQAAYALGMAFQIKGEPASAVPWYEQAASAGLAEAQILLGTIYARGNDVPPRPSARVRLALPGSREEQPECPAHPRVRRGPDDP